MRQRQATPRGYFAELRARRRGADRLSPQGRAESLSGTRSWRTRGEGRNKTGTPGWSQRLKAMYAGAVRAIATKITIGAGRSELEAIDGHEDEPGRTERARRQRRTRTLTTTARSWATRQGDLRRFHARCSRLCASSAPTATSRPRRPSRPSSRCGGRSCCRAISSSLGMRARRWTRKRSVKI